MRLILLLSVLTGLLLSLSWPTFGLSYLIFFAFVPLFLLENRITNSNYKFKKCKIFLFAYISFLIWNIIDTWWIYYASPEGMYMAMFLNSLFMTTVFFLYSFIKKKKGLKIGLIFFVVMWIAFEKLHYTWDLSWPWLSLGNVFSDDYLLIQWYEYTGVFGGSLWVLITNTLIFKFILLHKRDKRLLSKQILIISAIICIPIVISIFIYSSYRIDHTNRINAIVIQPNVDPYTEKFNTNDIYSIENAFACIDGIIDSTIDYIFLPETTLPEGKNIDDFKNSYTYQRIKYYNQQYPKLNILCGSTFFKYYETKETFTAKKQGNYYYDLFNSAFNTNVLDTIKYYHKSKLVPGVEILPFAKIMLPLLGEKIIDLGGISGSHGIQEDRTPFSNSINNIVVAPVICYESIFGEFVSKYIQNGANHIAIITNDGWWRDTQGYKQHFSFAKLRAIETRKSISRSANTGISGFINERGDVLQTLGYEKKGALKMSLPINNKQTFYVKYGDYIARFSIIVMICIFLSLIFYKKRK